MNEQIQLLKQQAGIDFNPDQEGLDLFAELIVRECVQVARAGIEFGPSMEEAVYTYFGVEE